MSKIDFFIYSILLAIPGVIVVGKFFFLIGEKEVCATINYGQGSFLSILGLLVTVWVSGFCWGKYKNQ